MRVTYLLLLLLSCCAIPSSQQEEGAEREDSRVSPDRHASSSGNHFSTSNAAEDSTSAPPGLLDPSEEEEEEDPLEMSSSPSDDEAPGGVSVPPDVPTDPKSDSKKDLKKKAKSPVPKKKDKVVEDLAESESTGENVVDTTVATFADTTTSAPSTTTNVPEERSTLGTSAVPEMTHVGSTDETTMADPPSTTMHDNLLSSDEQPPQTTMHEEVRETTPAGETNKSEMTTDHAGTTEVTTTDHVGSTEVTTTDPDVVVTTETHKETDPLLHSHVTLPKVDSPPTTSPTDDLTHPEAGTTTGPIDDPTRPDETTMESTTAFVDKESDSDHNSLSNDLEGSTPSAAPEGSRKQKQLDLERGCPCDERGGTGPECAGGRTAVDPNCPCREVCARQAGQSCSPGEPCDEEFGLHCNPQNNTCTGQLSIRVSEVSHHSAKITWGTSPSELQPQALVFYADLYRGPHTQWTKVHDIKPVITLENLLPNKNYYVKVEEDGKQEIATFRTKDDVVSNMPKVLVKQKSQTTLTVVWDDFRLPSYHSEYILEYRPASDAAHNWTKVQAGTQTIVTVSHLTPNTPYEIKVAVWEDDKLELPSEVITAYTADGCVRDNRMYAAGEEFFMECDFRCMCHGSNESDCSPRCSAPYVQIGSKTDDPQCYEKVVPSDPCCVTIRCTESKALEDLEDVKNKSGDCPEILEESESESKSCLSDCDHDSDCSGALKCCPSSCGGAVCVQPLMPGDVCEHVYCGPNAECVAQKMACVCSEGYEGNPHDFLTGCVTVNSTTKSDNATQAGRSEFELDLSPRQQHSEPGTTEAPPSTSASPEEDTRNELGADGNKDRKVVPTDAPFELDLSAHKSPNATDSEAPSDEENFHLRRPQDPHKIEEDLKPDAEDKNSTEPSILFDGCEYNNITYDRGVKFEDGCDAYCACEGQGHVSCVPRCNVLSSGGPACREVPDPDDPCCKIMICSFPGSSEEERVDGLPVKILSALAQNGTSVRVRVGVSLSHLPPMAGREAFEAWYRESFESDNDLSQWHQKPLSPKDLTEVQRGVFEFDLHDLAPQTDYYIKVGRDTQGASPLDGAHFSNTVNVKTFPAAVKSVFEGCFHHNQSYNLGEVFFQGCEHKCICREKGFIECQDRCAIYIDTVGYEGCDWVPSGEDPCCSVPLCNRRKIPLMPDGRPPFTGVPDSSICVVEGGEAYRVGDIWESGDGCRTHICRCTQLPNGTTGVQCQSECPPLPPNAHIPTARCPHPVLVKPDGPCRCPYVSCEEQHPARQVPQQAPRPQCEFKGSRYAMGEEFYDGCLAMCHCGQDLRVNCAAIECPYHFSAEITACIEWDIDPDFFPLPPKCCAPAKCKNDGSCMFSGGKFQNFEDIPSELLPCGARCVCVNGNVTCENRCPPVEEVPPTNLPCPPNMAYKGHPEGETCCLQWMCKEPAKRAYCMFQGSRYLVNEKWEVHKGSQQRVCSCQLNAASQPEVECRGGCPQIPQRFLLPTEQCLRPVIVNPDDPLMCPYVVCNNTISGQELYNVNVVALNSTAVRVRFSLSSILVGLVGHAELHFTADPTLPPAQWHVQKFSRPKRLFDSPNIEYVLNALRPNTTYFLRVKIRIDALQGGPESDLFKLRMPEEAVPTTTSTTTSTTPATTTTTTTTPSTTTTVPPMIVIDARPEAHVIDARTVRVSWRTIDPAEKRLVYALQLKYKTRGEAEDKWITTPMIHRDVTSYFLHDLEPLADYVVDMIFTPPKDTPTRIVSARSLEFKTPPGKPKEDYQLRVSVEEGGTGSESSSLSFAGIPEPVPKHVHVIKILYKSTSDGEQSYSFKVPKSNRVTLDHLKPGRKYLAQLELYLTNGQTLTSNEVEFITKPVAESKAPLEVENTIHHDTAPGKQSAELLQSGASSPDHPPDSEENRAYFVALVVVAVVAAVAGFGFVLLLVLLVRRQASAKAPISRTPSESAYDNPTYKTYDGERPEDKTNGQNIQTTQA